MICRYSTRILPSLNRITENIQVTQGRKYFTRGPHVDQPCCTLLSLYATSGFPMLREKNSVRLWIVFLGYDALYLVSYVSISRRNLIPLSSTYTSRSITLNVEAANSLETQSPSAKIHNVTFQSFFFVDAKNAYGAEDLYLHSFLTSALYFDEWSAIRPSHLNPIKRTSAILWIGG